MATPPPRPSDAVVRHGLGPSDDARRECARPIRALANQALGRRDETNSSHALVERPRPRASRDRHRGSGRSSLRSFRCASRSGAARAWPWRYRWSPPASAWRPGRSPRPAMPTSRATPTSSPAARTRSPATRCTWVGRWESSVWRSGPAPRGSWRDGRPRSRMLDREADVEEARLLQRFGAAYMAYRDRVPRYLPAIPQRIP